MNHNSGNTWVIVADSSACRIYEYTHHPEQMHLIKELLHPENQIKDSSFMSDRQGCFGGRGRTAGHGTFLANADPKETKVNQFSREIARILDNSRKKNAFQHLILISPPHMNGLLHQQLSKHVLKKLDLSIDKSVNHLPERKLISFVHDYTHII